MRAILCGAALALLTAAGLFPAAGAGPQEPAAPPAAAAARAGGAEQDGDAVKPEERPVLETLKTFVGAYNAADAPAVVALFVDEGAAIDSSGESTRGRDALTKMYADGFADAPGLTLAGTPEAVRFLTPEVAQVEGTAVLTGADGGAGASSKFSVLLARRGGDWRIIEVRDYPLPPPEEAPYERLSQLEWMVGDWVDESADVRVTSEVRWADNESFLVRTYGVEIPGEPARTGTMFIGWDPRIGQIKSWVFDSDGGHGEALWVRTAENQWVVKSNGVVRDGRPNSATQVLTLVGKDVIKAALLDRVIGGEVAPDVPEILMVRRPPPPGGGAAPEK